MYFCSKEKNKNDTQDNEITKGYSYNAYIIKDMQKQIRKIVEKDQDTTWPTPSKLKNHDQDSEEKLQTKQESIFTLKVNNQQIQENKEVGQEKNQNYFYSTNQSINHQHLISQTLFPSNINEQQQDLPQNENFASGKNFNNNNHSQKLEENYQAVDKIDLSKIKTLKKVPIIETNRQINRQFLDFPQESDAWFEYQSLEQETFLSKATPQGVPCKYCGQLVNRRNFIQLECLHFYCRDCLLKEIKNQCQSSECIGFYCPCTCKISAQTLLQTGKVGLASVLLDKLRMNQLRKLYFKIKLTLTIRNCPNKYCIFFCIVQPNQHQDKFYCPNCLYD